VREYNAIIKGVDATEGVSYSVLTSGWTMASIGGIYAAIEATPPIGALSVPGAFS
jgi:hypothetical protein